MHVKYLRYLLRHKWFVFKASLRLDVPLWQAIVHDASKFRPDEWMPYARFFYGERKHGQISELAAESAFNVAWNHHQKRNPHHWQYWLLTMDSGGGPTPMRMPDCYVREMVADWIGAGQALGKPDTIAWYRANREKIIIHPETRRRVEELLSDTVRRPNEPPVVFSEPVNVEMECNGCFKHFPIDYKDSCDRCGYTHFTPRPMQTPRTVSMEEFQEHYFREATKDLSPAEVEEVRSWFIGNVQAGYWDTVSKRAHGAILQLCSWGLG